MGSNLPTAVTMALSVAASFVLWDPFRSRLVAVAFPRVLERAAYFA